jgi:hypothetical protein
LHTGYARETSTIIYKCDKRTTSEEKLCFVRLGVGLVVRD